MEPEPSVETVDLAADRLKSTGCDLVVGLGGGSSMDVAKAVSVLATNEGPGRRCSRVSSGDHGEGHKSRSRRGLTEAIR